MRRLTTSRTIDVPAATAWTVLIDVRRWPEWGPSVRAAAPDGGGHLIGSGSTGVVTTAIGVQLRFRITDWIDGESWRWDVAGLPATGHTVRSLGQERCEVSFDVPWFEAPYLAVCRVALGRIAAVARGIDAG